jgi:hypothetical protein
VAKRRAGVRGAWRCAVRGAQCVQK